MDKPHFQLPDWGSSTGGIRKQYRNPEEFMAAWKPIPKSGWQQEHDGWRFYLGNGKPVRNDWYYSGGNWYWFDGSGRMVTDTWYRYKGDWYYMSSDGAMARGLQEVDGKWYYLDQNGRMSTDTVTLTPDQDGALRWPGLARS